LSRDAVEPAVHSGTGQSIREQDDHALLLAARCGDRSAAGALYRSYRPLARSVAARAGVAPSDIDDVVSDAFCALLGAFRAGKGPERNLAPYLASTVRNVAISRWRRDRNLLLVSEPIEILETRTPEVAVLEREERDTAATAFAELPPQWQDILRRTLILGARQGDIARSLGLSPNATAHLALRARRGLRKAFLRRMPN
jgi:RNA polymerase sigma factor (sigma-70 family)